MISFDCDVLRTVTALVIQFSYSITTHEYNVASSHAWFRDDQSCAVPVHQTSHSEVTTPYTTEHDADQYSPHDTGIARRKQALVVPTTQWYSSLPCRYSVASNGMYQYSTVHCLTNCFLFCRYCLCVKCTLLYAVHFI